MGFSTFIDILGSMVIGSALFLILLRLVNTSTENTYTYSGELMVQECLVAVVQMIETDFRKIGYCADYTKLPDPTKAILLADSTRLKFLTDIQNDGVLDSIFYYLGNTSELTSTENPRDRILYRVVNNETPVASNLGITQFIIRYYNPFGTQLTSPVSSPSAIRTMQINVTIENPAAYDRIYSSAFWRQIRLAARNLRNR